MNLERLPSKLEDLYYLAPKVFGDQRGFFMETYHLDKYKDLGIQENFVQDNLSKSKRES